MSSVTVSHPDKTPVNPVRLSSSERQFVIEECVICGETHHHGAKDRTVATGGRSHRVEHCHDVDHDGGYYLELAEDAAPSDRWFAWVGVEP